MTDGVDAVDLVAVVVIAGLRISPESNKYQFKREKSQNEYYNVDDIKSLGLLHSNAPLKRMFTFAICDSLLDEF